MRDPAGYADEPPESFLLDDEREGSSEPLCFDLVRKAFLKEYERRLEELVSNGGHLDPVEAPKLLARHSDL